MGKAESGKKEAVPPTVKTLDHYEPVPGTWEGDPNPPAPYDDAAGLLKAQTALRAKALKAGVKVGRISARCEWDQRRGSWWMRYSVDVLGWAQKEKAA